MPKVLETGAEFKRVRKLLGLTQQEFADLIRIPRTQLSDIERRKTPLTWCHRVALVYLESDHGKLLHRLQ